jgi:hypothetical protein
MSTTSGVLTRVRIRVVFFTESIQCLRLHDSHIVDLVARDVFRWNGGNWDHMPQAGKIDRVAVSPGGRRVVGLSGGKVYVWTGSSFSLIPGVLTEVAVSDHLLIGANSSQEIYHIALGGASGGALPMAGGGMVGGVNWAAAQAGAWNRLDGGLTTISTGADGCIWGTNSANNIYRKDAIDRQWVQVPGALKQVRSNAIHTLVLCNYLAVTWYSVCNVGVMRELSARRRRQFVGHGLPLVPGR